MNYMLVRHAETREPTAALFVYSRAEICKLIEPMVSDYRDFECKQVIINAMPNLFFTKNNPSFVDDDLEERKFYIENEAEIYSDIIQTVLAEEFLSDDGWVGL